MRRAALLLSALFALAALSACGDDSPSGGDGGNGGGPIGGGLSDCADVWVGGETLPDDYEGCENEAGETEPVLLVCTDDTGFSVYQDRFWAKVGGEIKDAGEGEAATSNAEYAEDFTACVGE